MNRYLLSIFLLSLFVPVAGAGGPSVWSVNSKAAVLRGDARGVSIDTNGTISLAPRLTEVFKTGQPYIWASLADSSGNVYLATGSEGRIYKVSVTGGGSLLADLAEINVTALALGPSGELFAATSPDGKVYRIDAAGKAEVYFDPKERYIWSLAVLNDGSLAVGTGESGRIYRVRSAGSAPESSLLFDTSETHIITLIADKQGNLFAGTDSNGLVMRFGPDGKPFALLDSPLREIHQLAIGPDGSVYVLAVSESASSAPVSPAPTPAATPESRTAVSRSGPPAAEPPQKSRYDLTNAKSVVYRILPNGGSDILWSSPTVVGFSLYAHQTGNGVLLGTSDKGRIYNIGNDGRETLVLQSDANQISSIRNAGQNLIATSSNQGVMYRFGQELVSEGNYESPILDAKSAATWGRIWWRSNGSVQIQTRAGNTENPDETWSQWASVSGTQSGQVGSPAARFLQWRAVLKNSGGNAALHEVNLAYLPRNIAPEVLSVTILPANVGLVANPPVQVDPNIEISGLEPSAFGVVVPAVAPRRVYQRGARSFQWTAEDRNGDKLVYDVYYKEAGDSTYKLLRQDITDNFVTIDGQSLADGSYTIKIVAKDKLDNPAGQSSSGERISEPFEIDNTQPSVTVVGQPQTTGDMARVIFAAADRSSYVNRAEYSVNGGDWMAVYADDGISDSPEERYTVSIPVKSAGEYTVTLRVFDANGNSGNARATIRR